MKFSVKHQSFSNTSHNSLIQSQTQPESIMQCQQEIPEIVKVQDGKHTKFLFEKIQTLNSIASLFASINITLNVFYFYLNCQQSDQLCFTVLALMAWFQVLCIFISILIWISEHELQMIRNNHQSKLPLWKTAKKIFLIPHILMTLIQPYPYIDDIYIMNRNMQRGYYFPFKLNYFLTILNLYKIVIILKNLITKSLFYTCSASRVCRIYQAKFNYMFVIKNLFKSKPLFFMSLSIIINTLMFSFIFRIIEGQLSIQDPLRGYSYSNGFDSFTNCFWFSIVTLTTVGYGDNTPKTLYGRIFTGFLIVESTFLVSIMVVVFTNELFTDLSQKRTVSIINRLSLKGDESVWAVNTIANYWRKRKLDMQYKRTRCKIQQPIKSNQYQSKINQLQGKIFHQKQIRKQLHQRRKTNVSVDDNHQQWSRQFQVFLDSVNQLISEQKRCQQRAIQYLYRIKNKQFQI